MKGSGLGRFALCVSIGIALLAGCGGAQPPIGPPRAMPLTAASPPTSAAQGESLPRAAVHFAYVANEVSGNVSAYAINASSGALKRVKGSPFEAGSAPSGVAIVPSGKFAYVTANSGGIYAYAINASSGVLKQVRGSPFASGTDATGVAIDPHGEFAYMTNTVANNVSAYTINRSTGALKPVKGSPFGAGTEPSAVAIDPTGKFAYVANEGYTSAGNVSAYAINASSGALKPVKGSPFEAGSTPFGVAIVPSGKFAYVTAGYGGIYAYAINASSGVLKQVRGSPFASGTDATGIAIDPHGEFAYMTNTVANNVSAYTISRSSGALTHVKGSPFIAGTLPIAVAIDPTGKCAYVANEGYGSAGNVSAYAINASSGALKPVKGSPFNAGVFPRGAAIR